MVVVMMGFVRMMGIVLRLAGPGHVGQRGGGTIYITTASFGVDIPIRVVATTPTENRGII